MRKQLRWQELLVTAAMEDRRELLNEHARADRAVRKAEVRVNTIDGSVDELMAAIQELESLRLARGWIEWRLNNDSGGR